MALSDEEIAHAHNLLAINEQTLRIRELQIERQGDDTPPYVVLDAETIRKKIRALKLVLEPELPDEISGLIKRRAEDDYFLFQTTLNALQDVAMMRDEVTAVKQSQAVALEWRTQTTEKIDSIAEQVVRIEATAEERHTQELTVRKERQEEHDERMTGFDTALEATNEQVARSFGGIRWLLILIFVAVLLVAARVVYVWWFS
jgi:hypothetical protein